MPSVTLRFPRSEFEIMEQRAAAEGVPLRWLLVWRVKSDFGLPHAPTSSRACERETWPEPDSPVAA
jgi:hypothetical protein